MIARRTIHVVAALANGLMIAAALTNHMGAAGVAGGVSIILLIWSLEKARIVHLRSEKP